MASWQAQDAKARFSELVDAAVEKGPQVVTCRGVETAVVVRIEEWRRLREASRPTLKEILLAPEPRFELDLLQRGKYRSRRPVKFD